MRLARMQGLFWLVMLSFGMVACDTGTGPTTDGSVRLWLAAGQSGPGGAAERVIPLTAGSDIVLSDDQHSLEISRVAIVLREIELERASDGDCDDLPGQDDDSCEEFEIGPMLLELPLDGSIQQVVAAEVPPGVYDELEFEIHKPEPDGDDDVILTAHPEFDGVSIRVEGTFDGEPFVFEQDMDAEQEIDLVPPLIVEEGASQIDLTLRLDVTGWFVRSDGSLVDPRTANVGGPNEELVEDNVERSIEVFEDDDRDGERDDD